MRLRSLFPVLGILLLAALASAQNAWAGNPPLQTGVDTQLAAACDLQPSSDLPRFARLMHDPQWMPWPSRMGDPGWPRGFHYDWYPETVPLSATPKGTKAMVRYSEGWLDYLRQLQPNAGAAVWITRIAAGLFNNQRNEFIPILDLDQLTQEPVAAGISSGGNLLKVVEIRAGSARVEMIYLKSDPPDPSKVNYQSTPWLVTKFTSVSVAGDLGNAGGIEVYFPNLSHLEDGYWVSLERTELFPALPLCTTATAEVPVLNTVTGMAKQVGTVSAGEIVTVREYLAQGSDVWGRTDEGWIQLLTLNGAGVPIYPTTWDMETRPPILYP